MKKRLGGNTTDIETSTTKSAARLDASSLQAVLSSLDSRDIAAWTSSNNNDIKSIQSSVSILILQSRADRSFAAS